MTSFYEFDFDDMYIKKFEMMNININDKYIQKYLTVTKQNEQLYNILLEQYKSLNNNYQITKDENMTLYSYNEKDTINLQNVCDKLKVLILEQRKLFNNIQKHNYHLYNKIQEKPKIETVSNLRTKFKVKNNVEKEINLHKNDNDKNDNEERSINSIDKIKLLRNKFRKEEPLDETNLIDSNKEITLLNDTTSSIKELRKKYRIKKYGLNSNDNSSVYTFNSTDSNSKNSKRYSVNRKTESIEETESNSSKKQKFKIFNQTE